MRCSGRSSGCPPPAAGRRPWDLAEELARLDHAAAPRMGQPGWFPDEDAIRAAEFRATTPAERVMDGIALSRFATRLAVAARKR